MNIEDIRQLLIRYFFSESRHDNTLIIEMYKVSEWTDEEVVKKAYELGLIKV